MSDTEANEEGRTERRAWFEQAIRELHERFADLDEGEPASYIPELAEVDPDTVRHRRDDGRRRRAVGR